MDHEVNRNIRELKERVNEALSALEEIDAILHDNEFPAGEADDEIQDVEDTWSYATWAVLDMKDAIAELGVTLREGKQEAADAA